MKVVIASALACLLAGCGADDVNRPNRMQNLGGMTARPDPVDPNVMWVWLSNFVDIGYDADRRADRETLIANALTPQCGAPKIIEDRVSQTSASTMHTVRIYSIKVACPKGASRPAG